MPKPAEGFLDPIEGTTPADAPVASAGDADPGPAEAPPAAETQSGLPDSGKKKPNPAAAPERPEGYVPKQALDEARNSHREEVRRERDRAERAEARFQQVYDRFYSENTQQQQPADSIPDENEDPLGTLGWIKQQIVSQRQQQAQYSQQQEAQQRQTQEWSRFQNDYRAQAQEFAASNPDFPDAYQHVVTSRAKELQALGYDEQTIISTLQQEEANAAWTAMQQGVNPGQRLMEVAKLRGWTPKAPNAAALGGQQQEQQARDPNTGQFVERAQQIKESQERNASLSQAPGAPVKRMTAKELAQMPEDEMWRHFDGITRRKGGKQFDYDMGFKP